MSNPKVYKVPGYPTAKIRLCDPWSYFGAARGKLPRANKRPRSIREQIDHDEAIGDIRDEWRRSVLRGDRLRAVEAGLVMKRPIGFKPRPHTRLRELMMAQQICFDTETTWV